MALLWNLTERKRRAVARKKRELARLRREESLHAAVEGGTQLAASSQTTPLLAAAAAAAAGGAAFPGLAMPAGEVLGCAGPYQRAERRLDAALHSSLERMELDGVGVGSGGVDELVDRVQAASSRELGIGADMLAGFRCESLALGEMSASLLKMRAAAGASGELLHEAERLEALVCDRVVS